MKVAIYVRVATEKQISRSEAKDIVTVKSQ